MDNYILTATTKNGQLLGGFLYSNYEKMKEEYYITRLLAILGLKKYDSQAPEDLDRKIILNKLKEDNFIKEIKIQFISNFELITVFEREF